MPAEREAPAARVLLFGDSHLAKFTGRHLEDLQRALGGRTIVVHAVGGSTAADTAEQLARAVLQPNDVLIISVGTNDLAPWKQVPVELFRDHLARLSAATGGHSVLLLVPPHFDEAAQRQVRPETVRTAADRDPYANSIRSLAITDDIATLELPDYEDTQSSDGVHLNDHGYHLLATAISAAVKDVPPPRPLTPPVEFRTG